MDLRKAGSTGEERGGGGGKGRDMEGERATQTAMMNRRDGNPFTVVVVVVVVVR